MLIPPPEAMTDRRVEGDKFSGEIDGGNNGGRWNNNNIHEETEEGMGCSTLAP